MKQRLTRLVVAFALVSVVGVAGCIKLEQRRIEYRSLDEVAVDAIGKPLWEVEIGDREIQKFRQTLWLTKIRSLYCIRDKAFKQLHPPRGLSLVQVRRRAINVSVLIDHALLPVIRMRERQGQPESVTGGCDRRFPTL